MGDLSKTATSVGITTIMRPEETLYLQQVKNLGQVIKDSVGKKTTKDAMYGGVATWDREKNKFNIHKSGISSEGNLKHIEIQCLEALDELVAKQAVTYDNLIYLYLNKAPCADYNGNRKNCLDKVIKWAKSNPSRKLVLAFKKPYAIGSFTERGSWHRPDKDIWPLYRMNLLCRKLPANLTIFSLIKNAKGVEMFPTKNQQEILTNNSDPKPFLRSKKALKEENSLKVKLLRNKTEDIKEFDQEKHLIKSFIMKSRKQEREIQRDRKLIFGKTSRESSNNSKRSFTAGENVSFNQIVPIEVN